MKNLLLNSLPQHEYRRLNPESVHFAKNRLIYEIGQRTNAVYFVNEGVVSMQSVGGNGTTIQIALVGSEGFIGIPIIHVAPKSPHRLLALTAVNGLKVEGNLLLAEFNRSRKVREILLRYSLMLQIQIAQSVICTTLHPLKQRLSRLILTITHHLKSDSFDMTQQELADVLGSHRNRAIEATQELKKKGLVHHSYGRITILDRKALERSSCECYRVVREWTSDLLEL